MIHTEASKMQIRGVISQNGKSVAFYSRKSTPVQITDTTT